MELEDFTKLEMTKERAEFVRKLRLEEDYTWRMIAQECFEQWQGDWEPSSNQLVGMALCKAAALVFNENYATAPWNDA